ncbi:YkgJ family cysteine cluster protein [Methanofollis sp. UBA420]|jgi:Fe-S-cluster containining protein|uniref:YkgJ family cysteine cluster protein n=1 Tax=Methanofollis sp. UBA420 TaxID=1915514 RepID=UPI00316ADA01
MREEPFTCTLCGRCCMGFGRSVRILRQTGPQEFRCTVAITGETFTARVEDRYLPAFRRPSVQWTNPAACPFLRAEKGTYVCTVHASRPSFCRDFACCRMRVLRAGGVVGELKGRLDLRTDDPVLKALWEKEVVPRAGDAGDAWHADADRVLGDAGYVAVWYREG